MNDKVTEKYKILLVYNEPSAEQLEDLLNNGWKIKKETVKKSSNTDKNSSFILYILKKYI